MSFLLNPRVVASSIVSEGADRSNRKPTEGLALGAHLPTDPIDFDSSIMEKGPSIAEVVKLLAIRRIPFAASG